MLFPTVSFLIFFIILFLLYWYVFRRELERKVLLVIASYVFYCFWSWKLAILMLIMSIVNYFFGLLIGKNKNYAPRKAIMVLSVVVNLLYLCFFKYTYAIISYWGSFFPDVVTSFSILEKLSTATAIIPIGISYYMFKCMSYVFDVYLCKINCRKSIIDVLLYVSFFPQVLSGPIVSAETFFTNLSLSLTRDKNDMKRYIEFDRASLLILIGFFKKLIVATFLSLLVTNVVFSTPSLFNTFELLFALLSYSVVIYCDFSGYGDMSNGIALLLGFQVATNFNRPYVSRSVSEFWRRWHITFSTWLREYVYFAFGGSRYGIARTLIALFVTMLIAGIWHGARLTFIIWGMMQGVALAIERFVQYRKEERNAIDQIDKMAFGYSKIKIETKSKSKSNILRIILTFIFINISWLIFQADSLSEVWLFIKGLANFNLHFTIVTPISVIMLIIGLSMQLPTEAFRKKLFGIYTLLPALLKVVLLATGFLLIELFATSGIPPFIYFQF